MLRNRSASASAWFLLIVLALIWGSSFILIKYALFQNGEPALSGVELGALRMALASLSLVPITIRHRRWFSSHWKPLLIVGLFGNGIPAFLFAIAQTKIDSSLSGMLNAATPLFTMLLGLLFFQTKAKSLQILGVLLGLAGTIALIWTLGTPESPSEPAFAALAVIGSLFYGLSVNVIKKHLQEIPTVAIAGMALTFAGVPCIIYLLCSDFPSRLASEAVVMDALVYVVILAVVGTAFALVLFNKLVQDTSAVFASSVTYLLPVVAVLWGLWDGEKLSIQQLGCAVIVLSGVVLVSKGNK